jgi:hypothetical protein
LSPAASCKSRRIIESELQKHKQKADPKWQSNPQKFIDFLSLYYQLRIKREHRQTNARYKSAEAT